MRGIAAVTLGVLAALACGDLVASNDTSGNDGGAPEAGTGDAGPLLAPDLASNGRDLELVVDVARDVAVTAWPVANATTGKTQIELGAVPSLLADDIVLVWQTVAPAAAYAPVLAPDAPGHYELARVKQTSGVLVSLDRPLANAYGPGAQVVRVPQYTKVTVTKTGELHAPAWDGKVGGALVFFAQGDVVIDGLLDATGRGLRGGPGEQSSPGKDGCTGEGLHGNGFAWKGEGLGGVFHDAVDRTPAGQSAAWNGGGGGVCHNSGGGGGAHYGAGGKGGKTFNGESTGGSRDVGGLGGLAITYDVTRALALGGGGGQGETNDSSLPNTKWSAGGAGGGVVFIHAPTLTGAGRIEASGVAGADDDISAGGGGGAGGLVLLDVAAIATCPSIAVKGGPGGNVLSADQLAGPGGGGGGGLAVVSGFACAADVSPGVAGHLQPMVDYGAVGGQPGLVIRR